MAITNTTNYNLKKPDGDEFFNIDDANNNMDLIDTTIKSVSDAVATKVDKIVGKALSDNNYADADKTIVGNVTTNLNLKADKTTVNAVISSLDLKVDKVTGKALSTNDYTTADKTIVDNVNTNLNLKVDKVTGKALSTNDYDNAAKLIVDNVTTNLNLKVDKVTGKALSTNDYTDAEVLKVSDANAHITKKITDTLGAHDVRYNNGVLQCLIASVWTNVTNTSKIIVGEYTGNALTTQIITVPDATNLQMVIILSKDTSSREYIAFKTRFATFRSQFGYDGETQMYIQNDPDYVINSNSFIASENDTYSSNYDTWNSNHDDTVYQYFAIDLG